MLRDLAAGADRSLKVDLTLARNSLRIGRDFLDFSVSTARDGYLYILQVGSDGKTFNLLFPNNLDNGMQLNNSLLRDFVEDCHSAGSEALEQ